MSMILSNLDEYAVLIKFLRRLNTCEDHRDIAETLLGLVHAYRLDGTTHIRLDDGSAMTLSTDGENRPRDVAAMNYLRDHDRIFEFHKRLVINFDRVSVMINDMPSEDADFCGRIRDHVAIAAESAAAKVAAMTAAHAHARTRNEISQALRDMAAAVADLRARHEDARHRGSELSDEMTDDLSAAFATIALTTEREDAILDLVREKAQRLKELYDFDDEAGATLRRVSDRLTQELA